MFKLIKRFAVIAILMAFSATAFAETKYCITLPTGGGNSLTKRDNDIRVAFQYWISYRSPDGRMLPNAGYTERWIKPHNLQLTNVGNHQGYGYTGQTFCADADKVKGDEQWRLDNDGKKRNKYNDEWGNWIPYPPDTIVRVTDFKANVKWGDDCRNFENEFGDANRHGGESWHFDIYRKKHNTVNPFGCNQR